MSKGHIISAMAKDDANNLRDMIEAIDDCAKQCNKIIDDFTVDVDNKTVPPILYHHTDAAGLWGILNSGKIRLTDIYGLNDPSEVLHGVNHALDILERLAKQEYPKAIESVDIIKKKVQERGVKSIADLFVACFSGTYEDLGQWRAYADDGRGFAIGFDSKLLISTTDKVPLIGTYPVTYDDEKLCEIYTQIASIVIPLIAKSEEVGLINAEIDEFMKFLIIIILRVATLFKHIAYINENEYRFEQISNVSRSDVHIRYRARLNSLISFTEIDWKIEGEEVLQKIFIGPAANKLDAEKFVIECLDTAGLDLGRENIHKSCIPYRNT
jgi:Protein of unknown function (DUF2971)